MKKRMIFSFLLFFLGFPLFTQGLVWNGELQTFDRKSVFRILAIDGTQEDFQKYLGEDLDDSQWLPFYAPASWKDGPYPDHNGVVVYRLVLQFDEIPETAVAIFLGRGIDQDWTYFNGELIGRNGVIAENFKADAFDVYRIYEIPQKFLRIGKNTVTIFVKNYRFHGGLLQGPYFFGPYKNILEYVSQEKRIVAGLLITYALVGITFLLLAFRNPKEITNWAFASFLLAFTLYFFARSQMKYELFLDYHFWKQFEMLTLTLAPPLFLFFITSFFKMKSTVFHFIFYGVSTVFFILYFFLPEDLQWGFVLTNFSQPSWVLLMVLITFVLSKNFKKHPDGKPLFFSIVFVLLTMFYDILANRSVFGTGQTIYIGQYSFAVFILTLSWIQAQRYARIYVLLENLVEERTSELKNANIELTRLATRDHLTGLLNRAEWQKRLGGEWDRYKRYKFKIKQPFSVLFLDMDHFKDVNDTYGHQVGDDLLKLMGTLLTERLRSVDVCARFGGDEFVVLLPETTGESAIIVAKKIHEAFEERWRNLEVQLTAETGRTLPEGRIVSCSIGVATSEEGSEDTPDDILKKADLALYQAKDTGKRKISYNSNRG